MRKLRCPNCGSELGVDRELIGEDKIRILLVCPSCGFYKELVVRRKGEPKAPEEQAPSAGKLSVPVAEIPRDAPRPIKIVGSLAKELSNLFVPVFFSTLYEEPPEYGIEVNPRGLESLGFDRELATRITLLLRRRGICRLYRFQEEAMRNILAGRDTIIVAQTAMGKTEAFLLPSLQIALRSKNRPAVLAIYPTKALARDQFSKFRYYASPLGMRVSVLDGDTPWSERTKILRDPPHILITNFDMIHYWLPRLTKHRLARLFLSPRIIIIDEAHEYYGAFGTHVHYILCRLRRLIEARGQTLQFVLSSATISNPEEFGCMLIGKKVNVVEGKGRRASLSVLFVYSFDAPFRTAARILYNLVRNRIKSLAFFNTRSMAELAYNTIRRSKADGVADKISMHRAGLPTKVRLSIEEGFKTDRILGLVSTPTLELGIDIGNVSAVLSTLTPVDRFIQRSGRAGRRGERGSAVLILRADDPISEYYAMHPYEYFKDVTGRYLEPRNRYIARMHTYLMAYEKPLSVKEVEKYSIPESIVRELETEGGLIRVESGWIANGAMFAKYFSRNIRGIDIQIEVYCDGRKIDEREILLAIKELYPGAIYLNRGVKYLVRSLDLSKRRAVVVRAPRDYEYLYTRPLYCHSAIPLGTPSRKDVCGTKVFHGLLRMRISVWGYLVFREGERKPILQSVLEEPIEYEYPTYGLFFMAPKYEAGREEDIAGAYHATEHILIEGTYRITGGSEYDLGGVSYGTSGIIVIHEALPGGNGVSSLLYDRFREAVRKSYELLESEPCRSREHLNKCVFSYHCGNNNQPLNQRGAREILFRMLNDEHVDGAEDAPEMLMFFDRGVV